MSIKKTSVLKGWTSKTPTRRAFAGCCEDFLASKRAFWDPPHTAFWLCKSALAGPHAELRPQSLVVE